jgi:hypothetical protein
LKRPHGCRFAALKSLVHVSAAGNTRGKIHHKLENVKTPCTGGLVVRRRRIHALKPGSLTCLIVDCSFLLSNCRFPSRRVLQSSALGIRSGRDETDILSRRPGMQGFHIRDFYSVYLTPNRDSCFRILCLWNIRMKGFREQYTRPRLGR